jgi:hypothetical protein
MAFTEEQLQEFGITEDIASKIDNHYSTEIIPNLKKDWDGKANKNAEGILSGASKYVQEKFGTDLEREQGEKYGDYLNRISEAGLSSKQQKLKEKEAELEEKLKNFKGSDEVKQQLIDSQKKNDALLQQVAELEPLKGYDQKYNDASKELQGLKLEVSFGNVKPSFPDTVNKYEASAKWNEFKNGVLEKNTIELIDGVPFAIDKENPHKKVKLSDLVDGDNNLKELSKGRQQSGNGAKQAEFTKVEGIPFDVPVGLTTNQQSKLVGEYLEKTLGSKFHKDYAKQFRELLGKVKSVK